MVIIIVLKLNSGVDPKQSPGHRPSYINRPEMKGFRVWGVFNSYGISNNIWYCGSGYFLKWFLLENISK